MVDDIKHKALQCLLCMDSENNYNDMMDVINYIEELEKTNKENENRIKELESTINSLDIELDETTKGFNNACQMLSDKCYLELIDGMEQEKNGKCGA